VGTKKTRLTENDSYINDKKYRKNENLNKTGRFVCYNVVLIINKFKGISAKSKGADFIRPGYGATIRVQINSLSKVHPRCRQGSFPMK